MADQRETAPAVVRDGQPGAAVGQPAAGADATAPDGALPPRTARLRNVARTLRRVTESRSFRWGLIAVVLALACYAVAREWAGVRSAVASLGVLRVVIAMAAVLAAAYCSVQVWRFLLAALGSPLRSRVASRIVFVGQLGKYLPGSLWPILAQMELASTHQVPRLRSATASVLNVVVVLLTGLLVALVTLPFVARSAPYLWAVLPAPVLLIFLHRRPLGWLLNRVLRLVRRPALEQPLNGRAVACAIAWSVLTWVCYGIQIWIMLTRLGASYGTGALLAVGAYAFCWCIGFVIVFIPAGAGVRDVLLVALIGPVIGVSGATAVALISRVLATASDIIWAAVAVAFYHWLPMRQAADKPERG